MNYREQDELIAEIGCETIECDNEIAELVTINTTIKKNKEIENALIRNSKGIQGSSNISRKP